MDKTLLFFGGPYSNLEATEAIQDAAKQLSIQLEAIYCTGDVVGYCADPEETVNLIRAWGIHTIAGNVEIQLRDGLVDCGCNFEDGSRCDLFSRSWYPYAQSELSEESIAWMHTLPLTKTFEINGKRIAIIHGGYPDISEFIFESTPWETKQAYFDQFNADVIIAGHCGIPFSQEVDGKLWLNAGVIGLPANDGTQRTWYALLNTENWRVQFKSLTFDSAQTAEKMNANKLPSEYAHTLVTGIWDNCEILPEEETAIQGIRLAF